MRINIKLDVSDASRNALAVALAGKSVKRLATREEVTAFVAGCLDSLAAPAPAAEPVRAPQAYQTDELRAPYSPAELREVERLTAAGRNAEYIRGWVTAGRIIARS